jgi:integrase
MPRKARRLDHRALLETPLVRTWHAENRLRSNRTADVNLRQLGLCLHELGLTPWELLDEARNSPARLKGRLVDYAGSLQRRGRLNSYIAKTFVGVSSFLRFHEVEFHGFPRVTVIRGQSIENERVPTQEELARLLRALPLRGQVAALLMAHAGLRPGAFAVYRSGEVALRLADLPELDLAELRFRASPFLIRIPGALSKNRRAYVTFGSEELAQTLTAYLRERRIRPRWKGGSVVGPEALSPESPVVAVRDTETESGFVTVKAVSAELRSAIAKVVPDDTSWRPYVLRSYASTQLLLAEAKGRITRDFREAILGHDLGVSGRYNLSKKLQPAMVEEMREAYRRCESFLSTVPSQNEQDAQGRMAMTMLLGLGYSQDEIGTIDLEHLDVAGFQNLVTKKIGAAGSSTKQRLVDSKELKEYLEKGWTVVTAVNGHQVVLNPPASR